MRTLLHACKLVVRNSFTFLLIFLSLLLAQRISTKTRQQLFKLYFTKIYPEFKVTLKPGASNAFMHGVYELACSDEDFRSGCCSKRQSTSPLKQSFSGLHSPQRSYFTDLDMTPEFKPFAVCKICKKGSVDTYDECCTCTTGNHETVLRRGYSFAHQENSACRVCFYPSP